MIKLDALFRAFCLIFVLSLLPVAASYAAEEFDDEIFNIQAPNSSAISYNVKDSLTVSDKALKIINVAELSASGATANTIILKASNITLSNKVEIVGKAADLILIADTSIQCDSCEFANIHRLTLVTPTNGSKSYSNASTIGDFTLGGFIGIANLSAPGALAVDLAAAMVSMGGTLTTHQKGVANGNNGYEFSENGPLTIGTGGINLYSGNQLTWNYESGVVTDVPASAPIGTQYLHANFLTSAFNLQTSSVIWVKGSIDTRSDLLASVRYKGQLNITDEVVKLQSYRSNVVIDSTARINSEGEVSIRSLKDVYNHSRLLDAATLNVMAGEDFENRGRLYGDMVGVAAAGILNYGEIEGLMSADIVGDYVLNSFGGVIAANDVAIESKGIVLNGSRHPYKHSNWVKNAIELNDGSLSDSQAEFGSFYSEGYGALDSSATSKQKMNDLSARILANDLKIKAKALDNINPYYIYKNTPNAWDNGIPLDRRLAQQVMISAEESMFVELDNALINSSAVMRVNQESGAMNIKASVLNNDRYRSVAIVDKKTTTVSTGNQTETVSSLISDLYYYSPPGVILSFGSFELETSPTGSTGGFNNNTSFFEVFGSAGIRGAYVNDMGIKLGELTYSTYKKVFHDETVCHNYLWYKRDEICRSYNFTASSEDNTVSFIHPKEMESLFYIGGFYNGPTVEHESKDYEPIDYYREEAVSLFVAKYMEDNKYVYKLPDGHIHDVYEDERRTLKMVKTWSCSDHEVSDPECNSKAEEFSVIDIVIEYVLSIKNAIVALVNGETNWWN